MTNRMNRRDVLRLAAVSGLTTVLTPRTFGQDEPSTAESRKTKDLLPIPDRLVVLSFDDGTKTDLTFVAPLLKQYGFGATFYISEGLKYLTDKKAYMTWGEVKRLHEAGFEIGNHTAHHRDASRQSKEDFRADVAHIEKRCRENGIPVPKTFCYPGYLHGLVAVKVLQEKGYWFARRGTFPEIPYSREGALGRLYDPKEDHPLLIPTTAAAGPKCGLEDLIRAVETASDGKITVLAFHGVPDHRAPHVHTDPEVFKKLMDYLRDTGSTVISMRDLAKYVDPAAGPDDPYEPINRRLKAKTQQ